MESQYLLYLTEDQWSCGSGFSCHLAMDRADNAARRLQEKCRSKHTIVSISILNPRWIKLQGKEAN